MDRLELADQGANDGLWDWDLATNRLHFSRRWRAMLGTEGSVLGNTPEEWFGRIHPEDLELVRRGIASHLEDGSGQFAIQYRMLHSDSSIRWMSCRGVITRDKDGKAVRIAGSHEDITGEKVADGLTGLPNRTLLLDRLERSIEASRKHGDLFAVLILDLDIPEYEARRFGPEGCDQLVVASARRLETCLRTSDTISRSGRDHVVARSSGGEFLILIDGLKGVAESKTIAERLLKDIASPFDVHRREVFLSASVGIAVSATGYQNAREVLRDADTALYRAKSLGKGRCEVFDTAILGSARARHELESDLERALQQGELSVVYQPILSLSSLEIAGLEALVRWEHPVRGTISPSEFIPVAERTGLIVPLGRWVIGEVCRQLKLWKEDPAAGEDLWVSVNLSSVQFRHPLLVKDICRILREAGLDAGSLVLELTEGGVMENPEAASRVLLQLRVTGARIALDDFGTGYSSLAYLCRFPLDFLKIDRSFVENIATGEDARAIAGTIRSLAGQLGLGVIAEGIENREQLEMVRSLGCEYGQGFLFAGAVDAEEAASLFRKEFLTTAAEEAVAVIGSPAPPAAGPGKDRPKIRGRRGNPRTGRRLALAAAAAVMLVLSAGVLERWRDPAAVSPADEAPALAEQFPEPSPETPSAAPKNKPPAVREFPVVHDHFLGSCRGTLRIARGTLSYVSENEKCSFELGRDEIEPSLEKDRLKIRTESRNYHFKAAVASSGEGNRAELEAIFRLLSEPQP